MRRLLCFLFAVSLAQSMRAQSRLSETQPISTIVQSLRGSTSVTDTVYWNGMRNVLAGIPDERVFATALELVQNTRATEPARLTALGYLTRFGGPGFLAPMSWTTPPRFEGASAYRSCTKPVLTDGPAADPQWIAPTGNPKRRVVQALDAVLDEATVPAVLRAYIECISTGLVAVPRFARAGTLSATYVCDNTFMLTMQSQSRSHKIEFSLAGEATSRTASLGAQQNVPLKLSSTRELVLTSGPQVFIRVPHGRQSCVARRYRALGQAVPAGVDTLVGWAKQ